MKLINLTKNAVRLPNGATVEPSGLISQVNYKYTTVGEFDGIPLVVSEITAITNIPPTQKQGVMYIVPSMVRVALPDRTDLLSPCKLIRASTGHVVGCASFEVNDYTK